MEGRASSPEDEVRKGLASWLAATDRTAVRRATLCLVVLGLLWRVVRYAVVFPLWGDEAFLAVNFLTRDLAGLCRPLEFRQVAPPAFLWAEYACTRGLGASEWSLRLVPFLAGLASLLLFWRFCGEAATRRVTLVAVSLLAASYFPVRHAAEVKPYAVDLLVSVAVTSLGWALHRDPRRRGCWLALVATGAVGVWCSYTAVFPVAAVGLLLFARGWRERSWRLVAAAAGSSLCAGLSWAAMMVLFARPQLGERSWLVTYWDDGFPPLSGPLKLVRWLLEVHTGPMMAYPHGGPGFLGLATAAFVCLGAVSMWRRRVRRALLALLLGPLPVALIAAALRRYPYGASTRLMLYMAPGVCLLAGEGAVALLKAFRGHRRGVLVGAALLSLFPIVGSFIDVFMPYRKRGDLEYRRFAERIASASHPGDRWVVFDGVGRLSEQPWVMSSIWVQRVAKLRYYLLSRAPVPVSWEPDPNTLASAGEGRTWLIVHEHGFMPIYPSARRLAYEAAVRARLGDGTSATSTLPVGSTVELVAFGPGARSRGAPAVARVPERDGMRR